MTEKDKAGPSLPLVVVLVVAAVIAVLIWLSVVHEPNGAGSLTAIDSARLEELAAQGARLVDVRTPSEYEAGHIEGAELVPADSIGSVADSWDRNRPVVLYCATGARSGEAARILVDMGFDVYDLTAGLVAWHGGLSTGGAPTTSADGGASVGDLPVMYEFTSDF